MNKIINLKYISFHLLIFLLITFSFYSLFILSKKHFIQNDELLLEHVEFKDTYRINIGKKMPIYKNADIKEINLLNTLPFEYQFTIDKGYITYNPFLFALEVTYQMTFGPVSPFLSMLFVDKNSDFNENLFKFRMINLIIYILSIFTFFKIFYKNTHKSIFILLLSLFCLSHHNLIVTSIATPYGYLILYFLIYFYLLQKIQTLKSIKKQSWFIIIIISTLFFYTHWLGLYVSFIFNLIIFIYDYFSLNQKKIKKYLLITFIYFILYLPGLIRLTIFNNLNFLGRDYEPIVFDYFIIFNILKNYFYININNLIFSNIFHINLFFGIIFILLVVIFFFKYFNKYKKDLIIVFSVSITLIFILLNLFNKFPFIPSRHTIFFFPIFLYFLHNALQLIILEKYFNKYFKYFLYLSSFFIISISLIENDTFLKNRMNFSNDLLKEKLINLSHNKDIKNIHAAYPIYLWINKDKFLLENQIYDHLFIKNSRYLDDKYLEKSLIIDYNNYSMDDHLLFYFNGGYIKTMSKNHYNKKFSIKTIYENKKIYFNPIDNFLKKKYTFENNKLKIQELDILY